ncbi:monovalent cation/H+ antiporter complex subunit F [Mycobacterium sp. IDR2000157661]|uniref:monovalent cation/H+ antiporter complex subunit F n=1 Tax=Mycobacterium sp. IDR2000157661 TaxID=2867005 RepID=UPI001EEC02D6|nr:monovalent cation/H+ antiporter complex subunit F [Mycobacterium sp. IDR2000157661]ULE34262.1 cation:proton antiporter [Mycobacterium sp. IDR2000157661]
MTVVWVIAGVMLITASVLTLFRLLAGPSTLDRLVALDALVAVTMCGIGAWAAFSRDTTVTYGLAALALTTFLGSVSVARFRVPDVDKPRVHGEHR